MLSLQSLDFHFPTLNVTHILLLDHGRHFDNYSSTYWFASHGANDSCHLDTWCQCFHATLQKPQVHTALESVLAVLVHMHQRHRGNTECRMNVQILFR